MATAQDDSITTRQWQDKDGLWIEQTVRLPFSQKLNVTVYGPINLNTIAISDTGEGRVAVVGKPIPIHSRTTRDMYPPLPAAGSRVVIQSGFAQWWRDNHVPANAVPFQDGDVVIVAGYHGRYVVCDHISDPDVGAMFPTKFVAAED